MTDISFFKKVDFFKFWTTLEILSIPTGSDMMIIGTIFSLEVLS